MADDGSGEGTREERERSMKRLYVPRAVPRFSTGMGRTASTARDGKTSENPKPMSPAAAKAAEGTRAKPSKSRPKISMKRETMATGNPPRRGISPLKRMRVKIKETP